MARSFPLASSRQPSDHGDELPRHTSISRQNTLTDCQNSFDGTAVGRCVGVSIGRHLWERSRELADDNKLSSWQDSEASTESKTHREFQSGSMSCILPSLDAAA